MTDPYLTYFTKYLKAQLELNEPIHFRSPEKLKKSEEIVRSKYEEGALSSPFDLKELKQKIDIIINDKRRSFDELNSREKKYIAQVSYTGIKKKLIEYDKFWEFASHKLQNVNRTSELSLWLHAYLRHHNNTIKNSDKLESQLKRIVSQYDGASSRIKNGNKK